MEEKEIRFNAADDVQEFVNAASSCDFEINLKCERAIVNAKSFLGVLSLGLCKNIQVIYEGHNGLFDRILNKYVIA